MKFFGLAIAFLSFHCASAEVIIASHAARFDSAGHLLPWTSPADALRREMAFYASAPLDHGYPIFVTTTFLDGAWHPTSRIDTIPATQNGMGILSYVAYYRWTGRKDAALLRTAEKMADYLIEQARTPDAGSYPKFFRSTGRLDAFPQRADDGSQGDHPFEVEPDKGAIAAYAMLVLWDETHDRRYLAMALHHARVLAANQRIGDATHSPWPFRVDYRNGDVRGEVSSDTVFPLRLYDRLIDSGYREFRLPRNRLWSWIVKFQIPSANRQGELFAQFFEDHENPANRNAWAPLNLARYLMERGNALDRDSREHVATLIAFVQRNFTHREGGVVVCHEQDEDHDAWGGVNSTYAAVLARFAKLNHYENLAAQAHDALAFTLYAIDDEGRPRDLPKNNELGGWQEDAHTDVVHNIVDTLISFPEWAN